MSEPTAANGIVAIVPVKRLEEAKSRLASRLSPAERARLVVVLLERVLGAVNAAVCVDRTLVVSADAAIRDLAAASGAHVLDEPPLNGLAPDARHNAALERAREAASAWRPAALLVLSADLPLLGPSDVQALVALGETADVVVAPDRRERGTNALFLRPADAIPFRFGSDSLRAHSEAAQAGGHRVATYRSPGTAFDLDEPEDLDGVIPSPRHLPFANLVRGRRSVRAYRPDPVPRALVEQVLEAARWAPSPHGRMPWRFVVLTRPEARARLADAMGDEWRRQLTLDADPPEIVERRLARSHERVKTAPVGIVVCLYLEDLDVYPDAGRQAAEETMAIQSLGAAAQNLLLAAYDLGLDGGWLCAPLFCPDTVRAALDLPPTLHPHALLTLGYAAQEPKRRERLPLADLIVRYE